jgi:hypothetical protein
MRTSWSNSGGTQRLPTPTTADKEAEAATSFLHGFPGLAAAQQGSESRRDGHLDQAAGARWHRPDDPVASCLPRVLQTPRTARGLHRHTSSFHLRRGASTSGFAQRWHLRSLADSSDTRHASEAGSDAPRTPTTGPQKPRNLSSSRESRLVALAERTRRREARDEHLPEAAPPCRRRHHRGVLAVVAFLQS